MNTEADENGDYLIHTAAREGEILNFSENFTIIKLLLILYITTSCIHFALISRHIYDNFPRFRCITYTGDWFINKDISR